MEWISVPKFLRMLSTQEDSLSLWFKVLPMKRGCKGQDPYLWHHYFLACSEQRRRSAMAGGRVLVRFCVQGGTTEDARLRFPCSPPHTPPTAPQPGKTLENGTFPSATLGDTATPGKAWVNTRGMSTRRWRAGGGSQSKLKSFETFQTVLPWT